MNNERFNEVVENGHKRTLALLIKKGVEYSGKEDRLLNFKEGAALRGTNPADCCFWYMTKHLQSISQMCKDPKKYSKEKWHEKLDDARNYLHLLEACLEDEGFSIEVPLEICTEGCQNCIPLTGKSAVKIDSDNTVHCDICGRIIQ